MKMTGEFTDRVIIRDPAGVAALRQRIEAVAPLLQKDLQNMRRCWWHFGLWRPAMNHICRRNNKVMEKRLPDDVLLSVDVAYRLARYMTGVGHATDKYMHDLSKLHEQLIEYQDTLEHCRIQLERLRARRAALEAELNEKIADDVGAAIINIVTACLFPGPFTGFIAGKHLGEMASGAAYEPYRKALDNLDTSISNHINAIGKLETNKKTAVEAIGTINEYLRDLTQKKDPVLQYYGMTTDDAGRFVLRRGKWMRLSWKVSFGTRKKSEKSSASRTPCGLFELAIMDVGIRPHVCESPYFEAYRDQPPLNVAFMSVAMTRYLADLHNQRRMDADARPTEMSHFAAAGLGAIGVSSTGRFLAYPWGAKRWTPPRPV